MKRCAERLVALAALAAMTLPAAGVELTPADDIQQALDAAAPGDTIVLKDGVYYQNLVIGRGGSPGKPITLKAANGGGATLSGAVPPEQAKLNFELVEGNLYKAAAPHRVWWAMAGARNLVNYGTLEHLKKFQFELPDTPKSEKPRLVTCVPEGFAWQDGTFYVRLEGGADPNVAAIELNRPGGYSTADPEFAKTFHYAPDTGFHVPGTGHMFSKSLANIVVKAEHVVIEGLRLRLGVGSAVLVQANEVTVRDCHMSGAHIGVYQPEAAPVPPPGSPPAGADARGLTVEYCEFSCYPCYQWIHGDEKYWGIVYHTNIAGNFMNYGRPRSLVRHNWLYECFDGLSPRGNGTSSPADASEMAYNLLHRCADDAIEFDSTTLLNLRVHHNFLLEGKCLLAISPVMGGGLTIDHNILYISREHGFKSCVLMKMSNPWPKRGLPTQGVRIFHNTMVNTRLWIYWGGDDHRYENMVFENNIFYCAESRAWTLPGFVPSRHNLYCGLKIDPKHMPEVMHFNGIPFASWNPIDFNLRANSPAEDAGAAGKDYDHAARGKAPDLGAIELGDTWQFPRPGPRWAKGGEIANRPPIPAVLPRKWIGLE